MKSTTCHKQTTTTSLTSATFTTAADAASHHRHHPSQYRNNSISCRSSSSSNSRSNIKMKPSDANNNHNSSMMTTATTSTSTTTAKLPIINSTPTRSSKNSEKYSLRQRQKRSFAVPSSAAAVAVVSSELKTALPSNGSAATTVVSNCSNLNSTTKRSNTSSSSGSKEKSKSKAAPLSKYRRKTANARERTRMREINSAFENLRRCVPHTITGDQTASSNEKLTKITTLRLAMKYIRVLSEALDNPSFQEDFLLDCLNDGDHRFTTPNWVQPPVDVSVASEEEILQAQPTPPPQTRPKTRKTKLQTTKVANKRHQRTKTKVQDTLSPYLTSSSTFSSPFSSSSSSAYASMSASPLFDDCHSMTDLSSMILESDGESLHLSEPCLSPMNRNYNLGMPSSMDGITASLMKTIPITIETENPLELSLRLLEPDADSLEFSTDQQPSSCISPLATLESFNPFGDLLHAEFPEHSSLDLFLT